MEVYQAFGMKFQKYNIKIEKLYNSI